LTEGPANEGRPARRQRVVRERLDVLLVERGLAPSRERARALIMAREVQVDGQYVDKAGTLVPRTATCAIVGDAAELRYVSRGGLKLERALDVFALDPAGRVCLDVGASTGGFTDVLLRREAARVYAIDVGHGQLAWSLRTDPRVVVLDRTNVRHLASLPEPGDCAVIDVSFISLRLVLPAVAGLLAPGAWVVALVKPQFEAGRAEADRGAGVIAEPSVHRRVLLDLLARLAGEATPWPRAESGERRRLVARGLVPSPITGRDGNHEYLLRLSLESDDTRPDPDVTEDQIMQTVDAAFSTPVA
jgi:23S rRNA (cytidine1920-2'-O)/16S rRNA (cytidine1409-2'-O)-methyltransferase